MTQNGEHRKRRRSGSASKEGMHKQRSLFDLHEMLSSNRNFVWFAQIDEGLKLHDSSKSLETLAEKIEKGKAKKILILCGAGVSVSAGRY